MSNKEAVLVASVSVAGGALIGMFIGVELDRLTKNIGSAAIIVENGEIKVLNCGTNEVPLLISNHDKYEYFIYRSENDTKDMIVIVYGSNAYEKAKFISYNIQFDEDHNIINDGTWSYEYFDEYQSLEDNNVNYTRDRK